MSMDQEYNYYVGLGLTGTLNDMRAKYYATDGAGVIRGEVDPVTGGVTKIINVETFAETAPISEKSLVFVQADETNDGKMTAYFHNGQKLFWLPSVEV